MTNPIKNTAAYDFDLRTSTVKNVFDRRISYVLTLSYLVFMDDAGFDYI